VRWSSKPYDILLSLADCSTLPEAAARKQIFIFLHIQDRMLRSLGAIWLGLATVVVAERGEAIAERGEGAGKERAHNPQLTLDGLPVYHELQEPIPRGVEWFKPTENEISPGGVLHDAIGNVHKVAALARELSSDVLDKQAVLSSNVEEAQFHMDEKQKVSDELPMKVLQDLVLEDDRRMKPLNDAMKGIFPDEEAGPSAEDHFHHVTNLGDDSEEESETEGESEEDESEGEREREGPRDKPEWLVQHEKEHGEREKQESEEESELVSRLDEEKDEEGDEIGANKK